MIGLRQIRDSVLHILFPHVCAGCGSDYLDSTSQICVRCLHNLPRTYFEKTENNPVERRFWGRLPLENASAQYFFNRGSLIQQLMHELKYTGNQELGRQLGRMTGTQLKNSGRFAVDALVPLPLHKTKLRKRGYNQALVICEGMADTMQIPVWNDLVIRTTHTESQTKKGRIERWKNMEGRFLVADPGRLAGKHILLVDDVITTGATLEACGLELLRGTASRLSVATLCFASR